MKVLAWRFDHTGDCNRYGNCTDHPYFELPKREELVDYPAKVPSGSYALEYVPLEAVTESGEPVDDPQGAFTQLRQKAELLRASVGEALHSIQRNRMNEVVEILDTAVADFDRVWSFHEEAGSRSN